MKLLATASALIGLATAAPANEPANFKITAISQDSRFNNKCVYPYHTGAGLNDATLGSCANAPTWNYAGDTKIQSNFYGANNPLGWVGFDGASYDEFYPVTINSGAGTSGVGYNTTFGFSSPQSAGFLACNWAHYGTSQVFAVAYPNQLSFVPANCATIGLYKYT